MTAERQAAAQAVDAAVEHRLRALAEVERWRTSLDPDAGLMLTCAAQDAEGARANLLRARQYERLVTYERPSSQEGAAPLWYSGSLEDDDVPSDAL